MNARWPSCVSLALVLVAGCDGGSRAAADGQVDGQAEAAPATPGPAARAPSEASSEDQAGSGAANVEHEAEAEAEPGAQPEPEAKPAVVPSSGYYGKAADELAAIYASFEPGSGSAEVIGKQAWAHYKAEKFHEAGQAFARLAQLEPEVWKHPFNAACAAARRSDLDRAQIFLVEALRRGGDEVRTKARKDLDLDLLRRRDEFEALMSAGPDELAAWEIREPSFELEPYPAGEAALVVHELGARVIPASAGRYYAEKIAVTLKVERSKSSSEDYQVAVTCKSRGQYLHHSVRLDADERKLPVGETETFELDLFNVGWVGSRSLSHCEINVAGRGARDYEGRYRLIASHCAVDGQVSRGPCADFERPSHRTDEVVEVGAEVLIDPIGQRPRFDVWTAFELGARPDFMRGLSVTITCKVGGKTKAQPVYIPHGSGLELARPGETVQVLSSLFFDVRPTWCEVEYFRDRHGPRDLASVPTYCYENGQLEPRSCS